MSNTKEIRNKIKNVKSTRKITKAMEMISISKMRKTQKYMLKSKSYFDSIVNIVNNLSHKNVEYKHEFFKTRKINNVGIILISTDRGLCGGLNVNLFKLLFDKFCFFKKNKINCKSIVIGKKGISFVSKIGMEILSSITKLGDYPKISDLFGVIKIIVDNYLCGNLDSIYICYNKFVNTMIQKPIIKKVVPLDLNMDVSFKFCSYLYEPEPKMVFDLLLKRYFESLIYQFIVENIACEQASRMVAMKSASDNASDIINNLKLFYNKLRQSSITREISEIVAGAEAV